MNTTILGSGSFGLAFGNLLQQSKLAKVTIWTPFLKEYLEIKNNHTNQKVHPNIILSSELYITMDLKEALNESELIFIAIPSNYIRETFQKIKPFLEKNAKIIILSKGMEITTNSLITETFQQLNLNGNISYLSGPSFASEIIHNKKTGLTLASTDDKTIKLIKKIFLPTNIEIEITNDFLGIELYGIIKNILAILNGSINSKYKEDSTRAYYLTKIINYAINITEKLGGNKNTIFCYGGMGDLFLTCHSDKSRNYKYGKLLYENKIEAQKYLTKTTVEGKNASISLLNFLKKQNINDPVISALVDYINGNKELDEVLNLL